MDHATVYASAKATCRAWTIRRQSRCVIFVSCLSGRHPVVRFGRPARIAPTINHSNKTDLLIHENQSNRCFSRFLNREVIGIGLAFCIHAHAARFGIHMTVREPADWMMISRKEYQVAAVPRRRPGVGRTVTRTRAASCRGRSGDLNHHPASPGPHLDGPHPVRYLHPRKQTAGNQYPLTHNS